MAIRAHGGDAHPRIAEREVDLAANALSRGDRVAARRWLSQARPVLEAELVEDAPARRAARALGARLAD